MTGKDSKDSNEKYNTDYINRRSILRYGGLSGAMGASAVGGMWVGGNYNMSDEFNRFLKRRDIEIRDQVSEIDIDTDFTIGFATDGHYSDKSVYPRNYERNHDKLMNSFENEGVDLLLFGGDNICHPNNGGRFVAQELVDTYYSRLGVPFYGAHGNHDQMSDEDWEEVYGHQKNYHVEMNNIGIIILDSADSDGSEIGPDVEFLRKSLDNFQNKEHIFILSHYWFNQDYENMMIGPGSADYLNEDAVRLIHKQNNVRGVLHGHNHGRNTGTIYDIEYGGVEKSYISGRIFGGTNESITEGYWIIEIEGNKAAAIFKTLSDAEIRTAGYLL